MEIEAKSIVFSSLPDSELSVDDFVESYNSLLTEPLVHTQYFELSEDGIRFWEDVFQYAAIYNSRNGGYE